MQNAVWNCGPRGSEDVKLWSPTRSSSTPLETTLWDHRLQELGLAKLSSSPSLTPATQTLRSTTLHLLPRQPANQRNHLLYYHRQGYYHKVPRQLFLPSPRRPWILA